MMKNLFKALVTVCAMSMASGVSATLIDRGNGMIYDSAQNITWLADANYARTSGYDLDGRMNWSAANRWAYTLEYGGYDDWRPHRADRNCEGAVEPNLRFYGYYNCTGNELGHLFYIDLGLTPGDSILDSTALAIDLFRNLQSQNYWSRTHKPGLNPNVYYAFNTAVGAQKGQVIDHLFYVWAVRDGDVAPAPEPTTTVLLTFGLIGVGAAARRRSSSKEARS
jgi:hypothetical protein